MNRQLTINDKKDYNFSGQFVEIFLWKKCQPWAEEIEKCRPGNDAVSGPCCKNQEVPYECHFFCLHRGGECEEWVQKVDECRVENEAKVCCEEQGIPNKCSAYCETGSSIEQLLDNLSEKRNN